MLTKEQKNKQIELAVDLLKKNKTLLFADFTGVDTASLRRLKTDIKKTGGVFKVIKKRLLKLALKKAGIDYDPLQFEFQVGTVFSSGDLTSIAGSVYKFVKELAKAKKEFKILGGYDLVNKSVIGIEEFNKIAKLPSREILLATVMGAITGRLRAFMYLLSEISKKQPAEVKTEAGG